MNYSITYYPLPFTLSPSPPFPLKPKAFLLIPNLRG
jgi:hypothetical protein